MHTNLIAAVTEFGQGDLLRLAIFTNATANFFSAIACISHLEFEVYNVNNQTQPIGNIGTTSNIFNCKC